MKIRILIIEDDPAREAKLCSWMPVDIKTVIARSAGTAIGILKRDKGKVYAGIMLDHDLEKRPVCETDLRLCGQDVVHLIIGNISRHVPILIHSCNPSEAPVMHSILENAGFAVERISMNELTKESFNEWLDYLRENWET